jgi:uncharacterized protein YjiS (DUF1127 family)
MSVITRSQTIPAQRSSTSHLRRLLNSFSLIRSRRDLASLDDQLLRDIGISREQAMTEAKRTPWDAPDNWT